MAKRKDVTPVIYIHTETDTGYPWDRTRYGHLNCNILVMDHEGGQPHPVNPGAFCGSRFSDIVITSQMDSETALGYRTNDDGSTYETGQLYAWEIGLKSYGTLPYRDVEQVIKTLRKMHKAVADNRFVHFADYVVASGQAIGAMFAYAYNKHGGDYAEWSWKFMSAEEARAWINDEQARLARILTGKEAA